MNSLELYESVIQRALSGETLGAENFDLSSPSGGLLIQWSGFYPNRWVKFCDDYLEGGPPYENWLSNPRGSYRFANRAHHTKGGCITSMSVSQGTLVLKSRACNWVPTGILDLKLLDMTWRRLGVSKARWEVESIKFESNTVLSYHRASTFKADSAFGQKAHEFVASVSNEDLDKHKPGILGRHKKAVRRARETVVADESKIAKAFTFAVPRDFSWLTGIRESRVLKLVGKRGYGEYQWDHLEYEDLRKLDLPKDVSVSSLALRRVARTAP